MMRTHQRALGCICFSLKRTEQAILISAGVWAAHDINMFLTFFAFRQELAAQAGRPRGSIPLSVPFLSSSAGEDHERRDFRVALPLIMGSRLR